MNQFKLEGLVVGHRTFATPSGALGSDTRIKCETVGNDGQTRENQISVKIWDAQVNNIQEGMQLSVIGFLRNYKSKDKNGNEQWRLEPTASSFKILGAIGGGTFKEPQGTNPGANSGYGGEPDRLPF